MKNSGLNPYCPRCHSQNVSCIEGSSTVICLSCSWTESGREIISDNDAEKNFAVQIVTFCLVGFAFMVHLAIWEEYSLAIIPLKVKSVLKMSSDADLQQTALICKAQRRNSCLADTYTEISKRHPEDAQNWSALGHIQRLFGKHQIAEDAYAQHFKNGGNDTESAYHLAKYYSDRGEWKLASRFFERCIASKPDTIQAVVIRDYVRMLEKHGKIKKAMDVIESVRSKGPTMKYFMAEEMKSLVSRKRGS